MSVAFSFSYFFGTLPYGLNYDLCAQEVAYPPGGREELESLELTMWRWMYPLWMLQDIHDNEAAV